MQGAVLICSPSARYHYDYIRRACPSAVVVWRAIPRQGRLPAQLKWSAAKVADEVLNLWDEQPHSGAEWFLPLNELQFERENGANFPGYAAMAKNLAALRIELRSRLPATVRLMFPAWVPQDDGDRLSEWQDEAARWDAICLHAYGSADTMRARYVSYRLAFPGKPIFVGEWNSNHEGHDERASLQMWAEIANADPAFLGATYYIYETNNEGEHDLSIWGNEDRLALFRNPPVAVAPAPPAPEPAMPDPYEFWSAEKIVAASGCALSDVQAYWPKIHAQLVLCGIADRPIQVAAIGTATVESSMRPIHEYGTPADWAGYSGGAAYAGRGFIQLTHDCNYRAYSDAINELWQAGGAIDLVARPDDALDPDVAAAVLALYFRDHQQLLDGARTGDWVAVRRAVLGGTAGLDRLVAVVNALEGNPVPTAIKLSDVLARGRSRIGDPYVWDGEQPGGFDCSGFIKWCYQGTLTSFTDTILGETARVAAPAPGDIVLYEYKDSSQPGVRFPHVGLFLSDTQTLDARFGVGVGVHDQLSRSTATRYYRRAPNVVVDTVGVDPAPAPVDELATLRAEVERLRTVLGYSTVEVAAALQKEADTIKASLGALEAAIATLKSQKVA